jgi:hypothetical protein
MKPVFLSLCLILVCVSCKNKKYEKDEVVEPAAQGAVEAVTAGPPVLPPSTQAVLDAHKDRLLLIKQYEDNFSTDVYYISKVHFDLPQDEEAWLVAWGDIEDPHNYSAYIKIYILENDRIIKSSPSPHTSAYNKNKFVFFDIMKDIPGERIGQGMAAVYDYDHDGFDEILSLEFGGMGNYFKLLRYDRETDKIIDYNYDIWMFEIEDKTKGPAPVRYVEYNGYWGFFVRVRQDDPRDNPYSFRYYDPALKEYTTEMLSFNPDN